MRKLVEDTIKFRFHRYKEINLNYIAYARERNNAEPMKNVSEICGYLEPTNLNALLNELTNEELISILDSQCCEMYR